jgi:hypothetical protein
MRKIAGVKSMFKLGAGVVLGVVGGVFCVLITVMSIHKLCTCLWDYIGLSLAVGIGVCAIVGGILAYKSYLTVGGYLMFLTSLIWVLSWPLMIVLPTGIGKIHVILFMLAISPSLWPILSSIGGILILSAREKTPANAEEVKT